ncbi:hypothetical protein MKW94_000716, partial [Papaver nudicaule]|nr:hypothetical protein [Papaver nudicaule]
DKGWDDDGSDEDEDNDEELDISDEDDLDYNGKSRRKEQSKGVCSKRGRQNKSSFANSRPRRKKTFWEAEDSSAKESDSESGDDFKSNRGRLAVNFRKTNGGRSTVSANVTCQNGEVRSSNRSTRKVSYAESEESEEIDGNAKTAGQKEDIEEEDSDYIERVLWHQPKGMAEDALKSNKSTQPSVLSHLLDSEPDWNETEFFIKWKGQSYLHCQWKSFSDLQNLSGFKKVVNYTKRVIEERRYRMTLSREEVEVHDVGKEMELDLIKQYSQAERIFADRIKGASDDVTPEYLVKWQGLSYAEATWERDIDIAFAQDVIDEYKAREAAMTVQGKLVDFQRRKSRDSLRKLDEQPDWLKGGKLRDYQLEGLNFLVN